MKKIFIILPFIFISCLNQTEKQKKVEEENKNLKGKVTQLEQTIAKRATEPLNPETIPSHKDNTNFQDYSNQPHGFSISFPNEWEAMENVNPIIILYAKAPESIRSFNVIVLQDETRSFKEVVDANKTEMISTFPDIKILYENNIIVNGMKGFTLSSTFTNPNSNLKKGTTTYFFLKNKKSYIITFSSSIDDVRQFKSQINQIINTFKIN